MPTWIDALVRVDGDDATLAAIAGELGEYTRQLIDDELLGFETAFYLHRGDLSISDSRAMLDALFRRAATDQLDPMLIVQGDVHIDDTFDTGDRIMGLAVIGDLLCRSFVTAHVGLAVSGDFTASGLISSEAGHGIMNVDGTTRARYEYEPAHAAYVLHLDPDVVQLNLIDELVRPEVQESGGHIGRRFLACIEAGENPFTLPMALAEAFARRRAAR